MAPPLLYNDRVFCLRESAPTDFDQLWRIDQECFADGIAYSCKELAQYLRMPGAFALVGEEQGGGIAGFVVAALVRRGRGHIITIDVLPQAQRRGLGSQLLSAAESRLQQQGCRTVLLEAAVDNYSAIAFYRRHGYSILQTLPRYYQGTLDALLMGKPLAKDLAAR